MLEGLDLSGIQDEGTRQCILMLLNLIEDLKQENRQLREEIQHLRDENNRLKGEQGKPNVKANSRKPPPPARKDYSSEQERHQPKPWSKSSKRDTIQIDREETVRVDPAVLPVDAECKGHEDVVVRDVIFRSDNVLFHKEKFYSPSESKTYLAPLPAGYDGQFGPGVKALTIVLYHGAQVTEPKIVELYHNVGVEISAGEVSNLLIKEQDRFHAEKDALYEAGLRSSPWQQVDDTSARVDGQNQHCQIVCNPLYTAYFTMASKDRQTVIDVLRNGRPRQYLLNAEADRLLERFGLSQVTRQQLAKFPREQVLTEPALEELLATHLPNLGPQQRRWILDALAVAAYHVELEWPVTQLLLTDDAPQFALVTRQLAECWIHEGRHYKKLDPWVGLHREALTEFRGKFWAYYHELVAYRQSPTPEDRVKLAAEFDTLFAAVTGYDALDQRIAKTRAKKAVLLIVLEHPEIPLHNNESELGARQQVRKKDISFGPQTPQGAEAWDTFMTLAATARKLGVSFHAYIHDRISETNRMPSLASLIADRAKGLNLAASWDTS